MVETGHIPKSVELIVLAIFVALTWFWGIKSFYFYDTWSREIHGLYASLHWGLAVVFMLFVTKFRLRAVAAAILIISLPLMLVGLTNLLHLLFTGDLFPALMSAISIASIYVMSGAAAIRLSLQKITVLVGVLALFLSAFILFFTHAGHQVFP